MHRTHIASLAWGLVLLSLAGAAVAQDTHPVTKLFQERKQLLQESQEASEAQRPDEAIRLLERVVAIDRQLITLIQRIAPNRAETLNGMRGLLIDSAAGLAGRYEAQEKFAEAILLREELVSLNTAVYGTHHWKQLDARWDLYDAKLLQSLRPEQRRQLAQSKAMKNQVSQLFRQGNASEAVPLAERVFEVDRAILGATHRHSAVSLSNLAFLYDRLGMYTKAEPLYRQAVEIQKAALGERHPDYALSLSSLAGLYLIQGNYAKAEQLHRQALDIRKAALGENHSDYAQSLNNLALVFECQGNYANAERLCRQALEIWKTTLGERHPEYGRGLNNLAALYRRRGNYSKSEPLYHQALEIKKATLGTSHPGYATSLDNLAVLYEYMREYAKAEPLYRQALEIRKVALGENHPTYATSLNNLAGLYESRGEYAKAEPLRRQVLEIDKAALGERHPDYAADLSNLAVVAAATHRWQEAAGLFQQSRRVAVGHIARVLPSLSELEQLVFLRAKEQGQLHGALSLGLARHSDDRVPALSAGWLLNGKALAHEALARRALLARDSDDPATAKVARELQSIRAQLAKRTLATPEADQIEQHRSQLAELARREEELSKRLGQALGQVERDDPWVELDEVRRKLPAGSVLVEIARFDVFDFQAEDRRQPWKPARYVAWVIPPLGAGEVRLVDLGAAEAIDRAVAEFQRGMQGATEAILDVGEAEAEAAIRERLARVAELVLRPLEVELAGAERWLVSPDAALWLVPWGALPLADGRYALEGHQISYLVSGRHLVLHAGRTVRPESAGLLLADPDFNMAPTAASQGERTERAQRGLPSVVAAALPTNWSRLFGTADEAQAILPQLAAYLGRKPAVYTREAAVESALKQARRPRVALLCTHGFFLPDQEPVAKNEDLGLRGTDAPVGRHFENPLLRCGLVLAGANTRGDRTAGDDGILTGLEVVGTDLRGCELVVLSACETGVGDVQNGEGVAGLRQAFQLAGAQAVVASLWKVPDRETAALMTGFWENVAAGQNKADALRNAQLALLRERRAARQAGHPLFWAAFTLTGQVAHTTPHRAGR